MINSFVNDVNEDSPDVVVKKNTWLGEFILFIRNEGYELFVQWATGNSSCHPVSDNEAKQVMDFLS